MRPTDADALMPLFIKKANGMKDRHGVKPGEDWLLNYDDIKDVINNAPPVEPQKIVTIPPELIEKLASCVVDIVGNIDWEKAIEAYKARQLGEWIELETNPPEFLGHRFYICSKCGREIDVITPDESLDDYPYCHCGACMIKESEK